MNNSVSRKSIQFANANYFICSRSLTNLPLGGGEKTKQSGDKMKLFNLFHIVSISNSILSIKYLFFSLTIFSVINCQAQETVTDYDGNVYNTITIGNQVWIQENLKSLNYSDGTEIPDVVAYDNDEEMAEVYGRLYTWDAAMRNSNEEGAQGIAPDGWHIPSDAEWKELENFLGGASVAGGKMKTTGTEYWSEPNTGADNSSGFSALPAGEYDSHYTPNIFQLLNTHAVFWTSTEISSTKARERYLSYDNRKSSIYDWYKEMKYSIRCIKDVSTDVDEEGELKYNFRLEQNYPNPFNPTTTINYSIPAPAVVKLTIYNLLGQEVRVLVDEFQSSGYKTISWDGRDNNGFSLVSGIYFYSLAADDFRITRKMMLLK